MIRLYIRVSHGGTNAGLYHFSITGSHRAVTVTESASGRRFETPALRRGQIQDDGPPRGKPLVSRIINEIPPWAVRLSQPAQHRNTSCSLGLTGAEDAPGKREGVVRAAPHPEEG